MDIKQLKYLIALDQARHFGLAAVLCDVTQPTLSMRIRGLEEELGLTLVRRGQRFEGFTPEGERILARAKVLLNTYDGLETEAGMCHGKMNGQLRIGTVTLSSLSPLQLIKPLAAQYPTLQFSLRTMTSEHITGAISCNQLDLGICYLHHLTEVDRREFRVAWLPKTRLGLLFNTAHFQFGDAILAWTPLTGLPLAFLTGNPVYRELTERHCRSGGLTPRIVLESDSPYRIIQAVQAGLCCAIMPFSNGLEDLGGGLMMKPFADTGPDASPALIMRNQTPQASLTGKCFDEMLAMLTLSSPVSELAVKCSRLVTH